MVLEHCLYFSPTIFKSEIKLKKNIIPNKDKREKIMIKISLLKIEVKQNTKYNIIQQSFKVY